MGIGLPDWYNIKKAGAVSALGDLGELAARLGSIVTFDRRGDVVWLDGFEEGIAKWLSYTSGTGASVAASDAKARNGAWSCKLTAGSDALQFAYIERDLAFPVLGKCGLEASFAFDTDLDRVILYMYLYDGTNRHLPAVQYDYQNLKLQYRDSSQAWVDIKTDLELYAGGYPFWTWKLVVDWQEGEYQRLILNETEYDLEGIAYAKQADAVNPKMRVTLENKGYGGANGVVYVDDVIITQNEP